MLGGFFSTQFFVDPVDPVPGHTGDSVTTGSSDTQPKKGSLAALCLFSLFPSECRGIIESCLFSLQLPFDRCDRQHDRLLWALRHARILRQSCFL